MVYTPSVISLAGALRAEPGRTQDSADREVMRLRGAPHPPTQACDIAYLHSDGSACEARRTVPALPVFEAAFSAFARGTLIATPHGPVAIEDLAPGMKVLTNERGPSPILWIGSMSLRRSETAPDALRLTRIMTGALGMGRPMADLMTGPGARIAQRNQSQSANAHSEMVLRPVRDILDGTHVIELCPPGAVQLYHIALRRHATIIAAGLAVETYHPGPGFEHHLTFRQLAQFIELFPHVEHPADFGGLVHPRAPLGTGAKAVT